jgi:PAS domain S-box-containing protein
MKRNHTISAPFIFLSVFLWLFSVPTNVQSQGTLEEKKILILHSFAYAQPAYKIIDAALIESFVASGVDFNNLHFEFLDLARNPGQEYRQELVENFRQKFKRRKIDLVITLHQEALQFLLKEGKDVYPEGPIICVLGTASFSTHSDPKRPIIHLPFTVDVISTVKEIFNLQPDTRKILVIAGNSTLDRRFEDWVMTKLKEWKKDLEAESIPPLPLAEILKKVANLPAGTAILYTTVYADSTGKTYMPPDVLRMISKAANAPVFGLFETLLGDNGIVGGMILDHRVEGKRAVQLAVEILHGKFPDKPLSILPAPLVPMFDWIQLKRWGFSESALPADAIILNKPISLWQRYKLYAIGGLALCLMQSLLIVGLLLQRRRKKAAEAKYRSIFEGSVEGVFEVSVKGQCLTANPAMVKMLGYGSEDEACSVITDSANQVWVDPNERERYTRLLEEQGVIIGYETQIWHKDGTKIWVSINGRRVHGPNGKTLFYSAFVEDITERKKAEREALDARKELWRTDRLLRMGELTASLAHELNQPLTSILSNARAAIRFIKSDRLDMNELTEILEDIARDDKRAGDIIRSLRSMVRPEEGEQELFEINNLLDEAIALFNSEAIIRNIRIETRFADFLPSVQVNRIQLQQVVVNLLMNATESMIDEHKNRKIVMETQAIDGDRVRVAVRDYGTGIEEQELSRIFEPFFTTKRSGLGMGLSLARSIIEGQAGRIWAENNPDGGTTFYFELPGVKR